MFELIFILLYDFFFIQIRYCNNLHCKHAHYYCGTIINECHVNPYVSCIQLNIVVEINNNSD